MSEAKPLSAGEEDRWRSYADEMRFQPTGEKMLRLFATLDAARAEADRLRKERNTAHASFIEESVAAAQIAGACAEARALAAELVEGINAALNMVEGDGSPPNWDWLRDLRVKANATLGKSEKGEPNG